MIHIIRSNQGVSMNVTIYYLLSQSPTHALPLCPAPTGLRVLLPLLPEEVGLAVPVRPGHVKRDSWRAKRSPAATQTQWALHSSKDL